MTPEQAAQLEPGDTVYLGVWHPHKPNPPIVKALVYLGGRDGRREFQDFDGGQWIGTACRGMFHTEQEARKSVADRIRERIDQLEGMVAQWEYSGESPINP